MNTANLQLQGLLLAIASINNALVHKGLLSIDEIDLALRKAEASLTGEERLFEDMSPANRDAICFPIRLLQLANNSQGESGVPGFSELARMVGQTKEHYNDQMWEIMLLISTYVAASDIEGVGVFAAAPIRKGTLIWQLNTDFDQLIPVEKYHAMPPYMKELIDRYAYPSPDRPGYLVYEVDNGRFMNHSDAPNTDFSVHGGGTATRDIAAGEELTCNYHEFYEGFELFPGSETAAVQPAAG